LARTHPQWAFTSLAHHIDLAWLQAAWQRTRKDGAPGIDGCDAQQYAAALDANLADLLERAKSGTYRAPAVRRVHIPKGDGTRTRPIGIPTIEDKVLQRAVAMVLEPIYEQDFLPGSYGFRPGRSAHQALAAVRSVLMGMGGGWVLEIDIEAFFDTLDHGHLRAFLDQRIRDGVLRRLIDKWLTAGVLEEGVLTRTVEGTPQGGVISPLLANVYLHQVLDEWFEQEVKPRLRGRGELIRYADDATLIFANEADARRVLEVLPKRFGRYGLRLHPSKTRLVRCFPPRAGEPEAAASFDLLGFTHLWGKSRRGAWVIRQQTAKKRFARALRTIKEWCRRHRHEPLDEQHRALSRKVRGHYAYFGITGNSRAIATFRYRVECIWIKWLGRRSQRDRMTWDRATALVARFPLPPARLVHRFA
jgi:group II intron reverse transcriptase/maturase